MSLIYKNIIGSTAVALIAEDYISEFEDSSASKPLPVSSYFNENESQEIASISLCNVHATDSVGVDLYYNRSEPGYSEPNNWDKVDIISKYHILKSVTIPKGASIMLSEEYHFKLVSSEYQLYIKLNNSDSTVDVIINKK